MGSSLGLVEKIDKTSPQKDYNKTSISIRVHMHNTVGTLSLFVGYGLFRVLVGGGVLLEMGLWTCLKLTLSSRCLQVIIA